MAHVVAYEGKVCNLEDFESYHIEDHPVAEGQFYVKGIWTRRSGATGFSENLFQGTEDECKQYVCDVLAPKLDIDMDSQYFQQFYGAAKKPPPSKTKRTVANKTEVSE